MSMPKTIRRPAVMIIVVLATLALVTTALATGRYVVYHISTGKADLPENTAIREEIDFEPDAILPYENYTEERGDVTVILDPRVGEKVK